MERRVLLKAMGIAVMIGARRDVAAQADPRQGPPREDDRLVGVAGALAGRPLRPADLEINGRPVFAYPADPTTGAVRDGSRLNQVAIVRVEVEKLAPDTRERAADGIVAYSGVCTHTGCEVTEWNDAASVMMCPCHDSHFDPADAARVVSGPAPRRLAALPVKVVDGQLVVAGAFIGRVGPAE